MKTITLFTYNIDIVLNFLNIFHPMIRNEFNLDIALYTSYSDKESLSVTHVTPQIVQKIKLLKNNYDLINDIRVYGLVASEHNNIPEEEYIENIIDKLSEQKNMLELDGQIFDYDFSDNFEESKKIYTNMAINLSEKITNVNVCTKSFGNVAQIQLDKIYKYPIKVINTSMYTSSLLTFYIQLYRMLSSNINVDYQIPAFSFSEPHNNMLCRFYRLNQFGYNNIAIFDPNGSKQTYLKDLAYFINLQDRNYKTISRMYGGCSAIVISGISGLVFYFTDMMYVDVFLQMHIFFIISMMMMFISLYRCCTSTSIIRYITFYFTTCMMFLSMLWTIRLYMIEFCNDTWFRNCTEIKFISI